MKKCVRDPVLGDLMFDYFWSGEVELPHIGRAKLHVDPVDLGGDEDEPPVERHREAYRAFLTWLAGDEPEPRLQQVAEYAARKGREGFAINPCSVPGVTPSWRKVLRRPVVEVHQTQESFDLSLQWNCEYTGDHGAQLMFRQGRPIGVAFAGDDRPEDLL